MPGSGGVCGVEDCPLSQYGQGLCKTHWQRKRRTGSTETTRFKPRTCAIADCTERHMGRGWCRLHYERWVRNGDPLVVRPNPARLPGAANCKWQGDEIGYTGAHDRVRAARGPATELLCVDCGAAADGWSYDHRDPDERIEPEDPKRKPYSVKPEHYQPRCNACHWKIDHPTGKPTRV